MFKYLLVTNDFPPKLGGIQNYLYELWKRLDPDSFIVVTTKFPGAKEFDCDQDFKIIRLNHRFLLPSRRLAREIGELAKKYDVEFIIWDPALPVGMLAPSTGYPYGVVVHGAELTVPARLPYLARKIRQVLASSDFVISAGQYPKSEIDQLFSRYHDQLPKVVVIPPGVDHYRFKVLSQSERERFRSQLGLNEGDFLVSSVSRLVPRKGMDTLVKASALLSKAHPELKVIIAGTGRDGARLERLIKRYKAPVTLIGRVDDDELPTLIGSSDAFAMLCRNRWVGLEQEGFGIVFVEASACGIPVLAGFSGGSCEAVVNNVTGYVIYKPKSARRTAESISMLISDSDTRLRMGKEGRERVLEEFSYDVLARILQASLEQVH